MRSFADERGDVWDVAVGQESYGTMVLLFARRGSNEVRRSVLACDSRIAAERELDRLEETTLRLRLGDAQTYAPGAVG